MLAVLHLLKLALFLLGRKIQVFVHLGVIFFTVFLKLLSLFLQDIVKMRDYVIITEHLMTDKQVVSCPGIQIMKM